MSLEPYDTHENNANCYRHAALPARGFNYDHPPLDRSHDAEQPPISAGRLLGPGNPHEFSSPVAEISFACVCSTGQLLFAIHLANTFVNQILSSTSLRSALASLHG